MGFGVQLGSGNTNSKQDDISTELCVNWSEPTMFRTFKTVDHPPHLAEAANIDKNETPFWTPYSTRAHEV